MKKTKSPSLHHLLDAIREVFKKHPYKTFNYKQVWKQLESRYGKGAEKIIPAQLEKSSIRELLLQSLKTLAAGSELIETETGKYKLFPSQSFAEGIIDVVSSGAAYVMDEDYEDDIYIAPRNVKNALKGDRVKVFLYAKRKGHRFEGEVTEVVERARTEFAGVVQVSPKFAFLVPDSSRIHVDIFIPISALNGARHGDKAVARLTDWHQASKNPSGEIVKILGRPGENDAEMDAILVEYGFPLKFPDAVEREAFEIPDSISHQEIAKRRDFRSVKTFTIDPVDAKDFDDALSVRRVDKNFWEIGVHIADVSHYVKPGSALDKEAYHRATSIYLVDRVIPMLPEKLSNEVCSLRPDEDKLCFAAVFQMDENANVQDVWFGRTVIRSDKRFTYEEAQEIIESGKGIFSSELLLLNALAKKLRTERLKKGAITFEKAEVKFRLDEKGNPLGVYLKENKDSNKLIEEFMLLANRYVAEFAGKLKAKKGSSHEPENKPDSGRPFVYRIHDSPPSDKLEDFARFASRFGYKINTGSDKAIAHSLNKLLSDVQGKSEQNVLEQLAVRSMSKARYTTENIGHYGLAFDYYTHFTSPIRRYPDVMVHRLLDQYIRQGAGVHRDELEKKCTYSTEMEIQAAEAERASIKYKQVQFMDSQQGKEFEGIISGVTEWGIYVELKENKCEGLIRLRDIGDDFYELDEKNYCIRGMRTRRVFQLGDEVKVILKKTDLMKKQIDFMLAGQKFQSASSEHPTRTAVHKKGNKKKRR